MAPSTIAFAFVSISLLVALLVGLVAALFAGGLPIIGSEMAGRVDLFLRLALVNDIYLPVAHLTCEAGYYFLLWRVGVGKFFLSPRGCVLPFIGSIDAVAWGIWRY
ncbi:MAG: hypothetical protein ACSLEM_02140 [Candidatus Malihini olakiniferum]